MSATPIPRTLSLTLFGDLDVSVIDELPPGRQPVETRWVAPEERSDAYEFVRSQVREGRQAFVVCPLVEESETLDAKAALLEPPAPIQPSAIAAARQTAAGWWLPTQIGGCGAWSGRVPSVASSTWKISPR